MLSQVDDDYLIGLANKGIVKRAYKDMEEGGERVVSMAEEAVVEAGGETVTVRMPLGESGCSCPSRTICRHVVRAILFLKAQTAAGNAVPAAEALPGSSAPAPEVPSGSSAPEPEVPSGNAGPASEVPPGNASPTPEVSSSQTFSLQQEINTYSLPALKKAMGPRGFLDFTAQLHSGFRPEIQKTSIFTVILPGQITVKLLSPLEYSTCTCHKKELCPHKAAAILWCQLEAGAFKEADLAEAEGTGPQYDKEQIQAAADQMLECLEALFDTGLSRTSPDMPDTLERLAVVAHNARLANLEGDFRALSENYSRYLKREASLQAGNLLNQTVGLYNQVCRVRDAKSQQELAACAGEFKAGYMSVGDLELTGIALEQFESRSGYEGDTVYFLEERTGTWYTYTNSRPTFYEQKNRRANMDKSQAPWGLPVSMEQLPQVKIRLTGAKADSRGRLSSSQATKGEITGGRTLSRSRLEGWYYNDFKKLFQEQILDKPMGERVHSLVILSAASWGASEFTAATQQLKIPLFDRAGREVVMELTYTQKESQAIRYLERLSARLEKQSGSPDSAPPPPPCIVGKLTLRDNRLRIYPISLIEEAEIDE